MLDVEQKLKNKNKILFNRQSVCLQELRLLIEQQTHRTIILWIFDCVQIPLDEMKKRYPKETCYQEAMDACMRWAQGEIKMPEAKRFILNVHAQAKMLKDPVEIALCHAIGQGISCVHTETHALGLMFYELTALVLAHKEYEDAVNKKVKYYEERLLYWQAHGHDEERKWATFLLKDKQVNREWLLHQKEISK